MLNIKKILLPVDFPNTSLGVVHQAAALARRFHSEVVILHVVTARNHAAHLPEDLPSPADWDLVAEIIRGARKELDESLAAGSMALPFDASWREAAWLGQSCRRLRKRMLT